MNFGKATILGILLWVLIFVEFSALMFIPGLNSTVQVILHLIILPFLVWICCSMYFKKNKGGWKEGFLFGACLLIIGEILDALITVPLFVKSYSVFYMQWNLWVGFVEMIIFTTIFGSLKKGKGRRK